MKDLVAAINKIRRETECDAVVLGADPNHGDYVALIIVKGGMEQEHRMLSDTETTLGSIIEGFNKSYAEYLELE